MSRLINLTSRNGSEITIFCHTWETSKAWGHIAHLFINGEDKGSVKARYYNRTWESWRYQSVCTSVINTEIERLSNRAINAYKIANNRQRLNAAEKADIINGVERIQDLREIKERLYNESF